MKICIVSYLYPNKYSSSDQVFVKMLVDEFARQGHDCVVVSPFNTLHYRHISKESYYYEIEGNKVKVICPNYLSVSNIRIGKYNVSEFLHKHAIERALNRLDFKPDVIYCHFWKQGYKSYNYAKKHNIPLVIASGECDLHINNNDGKLNSFVEYVKAVVCVSTKNRDESIDYKLTSEDKCAVFPNSIDENLFKLLDKEDCRKKLGLPQGKFIVAFVGWFANRKGSKRVSDAISRIKTNDVYSLFIGSGNDLPECNNVLFTGKVDHDQLPLFLNAADAFVLPTLQEGCCNAIIEAMACGLPIVSSNLPFNWDVLNSKNSIMIDPMDIDAISEAIIQLKNNNAYRESIRNAVINSAKGLTIKERAKNIIAFIQDKI